MVVNVIWLKDIGVSIPATVSLIYTTVNRQDNKRDKKTV